MQAYLSVKVDYSYRIIICSFEHRFRDDGLFVSAFDRWELIDALGT